MSLRRTFYTGMHNNNFTNSNALKDRPTTEPIRRSPDGNLPIIAHVTFVITSGVNNFCGMPSRETSRSDRLVQEDKNV